MILSACKRDVVAVVSYSSHQIFMDHSKDELIVDGALAFCLCLNRVQLLLTASGHEIFFSAVESVGRGLHSFGGCWKGFEQEAKDEFNDECCGIISFEQLEADVRESDVLSPSRICHVLLRGLLF